MAALIVCKMFYVSIEARDATIKDPSRIMFSIATPIGTRGNSQL